jgi:hypothetical protein
MARATVNTADARGVKLPGFTYANVMATIAVFLTLGGGAYAATQLPKDSVGTNQLKAAAVTPAKLSATAKETLTGAPGVAGPAGERGPAGPQGTRGEVGPAGSPDTPLQVLEKVKQVDGEDSGLDAELLDGLSASEFARSGGASLHEPLSPYDCEENLTPHWIAGPGYFGYFRDQSGFVHLEGLAAPCEVPSAFIFNLPPGYRPKQGAIEFGFLHGTVPVRVEILHNGNVQLPATPGEETLLVNGISFRCSPSGVAGCP